MWLKQFKAVVGNAVGVVIGDPFFLILHITALLLLALLAAIPGFTYGEHIKLLRDQCQALIFMIGCLTIIFGFIRSLTDDLRRGTGSILMSRPLGALSLISGKWAGVIISTMVLQLSLLVSYLWISEISFDAEFLNTKSLIHYLLIIAISLALSALRHYLFGGSYALHANLILSGFISFFFIIRVISRGPSFFDWYGCQSGIILFFGLVAFSAILLPVVIIVDSAMVLSIGLAIFFFGLISEYFLTLIFSSGSLSTIFRSIIPNWQYYWVADRLGEGHSIPISYFMACGLQSTCIIVIYMILAMVLYKRTEIDTKA